MRKAVRLMKISFVYSALIWATLSAPIFAATNRSYFELISQVHNYYSTSCIFIVHSKQEGDEELHHIGAVLRQFSNRGVFAIALEFVKLNETVRYYRRRIVRALVVVSLPSREVVDEFSRLTANFNMAIPCWLLIFEEKLFLDLFSEEPNENIFHLQFDTEFLIARTQQTIVQEWYGLRNIVKKQDLAVWNFDNTFVLNTNKSLYQRRTNLEGSLIVVTVFNNPPMISFVNNTIGGLFGTILLELSRQANFKMEFASPKEFSYGSWNPEENRWTGMMEMLTRNKAGVAAADFTITTPRLDCVDFTLPLISTREKLYIRKPTGGIDWSAYWQAFTPGIWIIIQLLIIVTTVLLSLITAIRGRRVTLDAFTGYFLLVMGIYCQQGLPDFPIDLPSRIAYFSIFISALIVSAGYSAALISYLTVTGSALPFTTLEGFVEDGTYELIVFQDGADYDAFATATEPTMVKMWSMMKVRALLPVTLMNGFEQVCDGKVAFYVPAALEETLRIYLPCKVVGIDTKQSLSLAMAMSKKNPYNGLINYHVQRFRDHGILNRLKGIYSVSTEAQTLTAHAEVTLWGVMPVISILAAGGIIAAVIFYLEKIIAPKTEVGLKRRGIRGTRDRGEDILKIRLRDRVKYNPAAISEFRY